MAAILNRSEVRSGLKQQGIDIPSATYFVAAVHVTTTDGMVVYDDHVPTRYDALLSQLKTDVAKVQRLNCQRRLAQLSPNQVVSDPVQAAWYRSKNAAQPRPEWGLARNAALVVGPRCLTRDVDLDGRVFLHSYDWVQDAEGKILTQILMGPMLVAQQINAQYLFSTLDNVAYGGGRLATQNITVGFGVMQGNASDMMSGLPYEAVYRDHDEAYHAPLRLTVVVHAPMARMREVVCQQPALKRLVANAWIDMVCLEPEIHAVHRLGLDLCWQLQA